MNRSEPTPGLLDVTVAGQPCHEIPEGLPGPLTRRIGQILSKPVDIGTSEIGKRDALLQGSIRSAG
jgi:hypothetical protein